MELMSFARSVSLFNNWDYISKPTVVYPKDALGKCFVQLYARFFEGICTPFHGNLIMFQYVTFTEGFVYLSYG